ncbi:uncharacterized protein [Dermacentor albipictus]|uniref:uncharacterized protein isoform X2 n=1 Tax=Dermacentor albipictus TaxID=60249 RepID=UPI0038FC0870
MHLKQKTRENEEFDRRAIPRFVLEIIWHQRVPNFPKNAARKGQTHLCHPLTRRLRRNPKLEAERCWRRGRGPAVKSKRRKKQICPGTDRPSSRQQPSSSSTSHATWRGTETWAGAASAKSVITFGGKKLTDQSTNQATYCMALYLMSSSDVHGLTPRSWQSDHL